MKRRSRQLRTSLLVLIGWFAATTTISTLMLLLMPECVPLASASTTTGTTTTATATANPSSSSSGRAGKKPIGGDRERRDFGGVDDVGDDGVSSSGYSDNDAETAAATATAANNNNNNKEAPRQKSSWQFFYRKDETSTAATATETTETTEEGNDDATNDNDDTADATLSPSSLDESDKNNVAGPRFRFGVRRPRRNRRGRNEDTLEEMFTTKDGNDRDESDEANESEAKDAEEENSETAKQKNDDDVDVNHDDSSKVKDESSLSSSESKDGKDADADADDNSETKKEDEADDEQKEEKEKDSAPGNKSNEPQPDPMQQYIEQYQNAQRMQQQRLMGYPGAIIYRSSPLQQHPHHHHQLRPGMSPQDGHGNGLPTLAPGQAMAAAALVNMLALASRIFFVKWIIDRLAFESESKSPVQHFMWECLNDKFVKDDEIWKRVLGRAPQSMGVSQRRWGRTVKSMGPNKERQKDRTKKTNQRNKNVNTNTNTNTNTKKNAKDQRQKGLVMDPTKNDQMLVQQPSNETPKTVVVMDFSTVNAPNPDFLRFADVVTFLVGSNGPQKQMFGSNPEVVLMLQSPGGEVTSFAFAAAQVARLRNAGWNVTVCVDRIAASGGYMIASQATQILASPFAMVGSVGVITESLNFYEILKQHGIQSLVLKAGDSKNPLTQFGKVTDEDIKTTQKDLDETHESFIDLCRSRRPGLDPTVCNGRILSGDTALEKGMIDRILTSDEYILEKIAEGDLVMKLHLVSGNSERHMIANALQILPHLSSKFKRFMFAGGGDDNDSNVVKRALGKLSSWVDGRVRMDGNFASRVVQLIGLASMVRRAVGRSGSFPNEATNDYTLY